MWLNAYGPVAQGGELFFWQLKQVEFKSHPPPFLLSLGYSTKICSGMTNKSPSYQIVYSLILEYLGD